MLLLRQIGFVLEDKCRGKKEYFMLSIEGEDVEELLNDRVAAAYGIQPTHT